MTYEQAGELLGLSAEAVRKRSRRLGWRIQSGNEGKALVLVPDGAELRPPGRPGGRATGDRADTYPGSLTFGPAHNGKGWKGGAGSCPGGAVCPLALAR